MLTFAYFYLLLFCLLKCCFLQKRFTWTSFKKKEKKKKNPHIWQFLYSLVVNAWATLESITQETVSNKRLKSSTNSWMGRGRWRYQAWRRVKKKTVSLLSPSFQLRIEPWPTISKANKDVSQQLKQMPRLGFMGRLPLTRPLWHLHLIHAMLPLVCACLSQWINAIKPSSEFSIYLHSPSPVITKQPVWWLHGAVR